tara:strand:- start:14 stop:556 length:543 start_codon:yes stop_codon:yes gene_type:complete
MSTAVYLIGAPGVGKSTVMKLVTQALSGDEGDLISEPIPHIRYANGWAQLGARREDFPGTDTLSYTAIDSVEAWLDSPDRPKRLLAEGDRLAIDRMMETLYDNYSQFLLVHLTAQPAISYERMTARAERLGRQPQNEAWWRGRTTKASNLAGRWNAHDVSAEGSTQHAADDVLALIARDA